MSYDPNGLNYHARPSGADYFPKERLSDMFKDRSSRRLMAVGAALLGGCIALNTFVESPRLFDRSAQAVTNMPPPAFGM